VSSSPAWSSFLLLKASIGKGGNTTSHMLASDSISAAENPCLYLLCPPLPLTVDETPFSYFSLFSQ